MLLNIILLINDGESELRTSSPDPGRSVLPLNDLILYITFGVTNLPGTVPSSNVSPWFDNLANLSLVNSILFSKPTPPVLVRTAVKSKSPAAMFDVSAPDRLI